MLNLKLTKGKSTDLNTFIKRKSLSPGLLTKRLDTQISSASYADSEFKKSWKRIFNPTQTNKTKDIYQIYAGQTPHKLKHTRQYKQVANLDKQELRAVFLSLKIKYKRLKTKEKGLCRNKEILRKLENKLKKVLVETDKLKKAQSVVLDRAMNGLKRDLEELINT